MLIALAIFGSLVGLFAVGAAAATGWVYFSARKKAVENQSEIVPAQPPWNWFFRWTIADYAVILLFGLGLVFLLADLIGVAQDRDLYPEFHYPYLVCGFVFSAMGMLLSAVRLAIVLRLASRLGVHGRDADKPEHAEHAKQGVQG